MEIVWTYIKVFVVVAICGPIASLSQPCAPPCTCHPTGTSRVETVVNCANRGLKQVETVVNCANRGLKQVPRMITESFVCESIAFDTHTHTHTQCEIANLSSSKL